jgi:hypothetical protein
MRSACSMSAACEANAPRAIFRQRHREYYDWRERARQKFPTFPGELGNVGKEGKVFSDLPVNVVVSSDAKTHP